MPVTNRPFLRSANRYSGERFDSRRRSLIGTDLDERGLVFVGGGSCPRTGKPSLPTARPFGGRSRLLREAPVRHASDIRSSRSRRRRGPAACRRPRRARVDLFVTPLHPRRCIESLWTLISGYRSDRFWRKLAGRS